MDASRIFSRLPIKGPSTNNTLDGAQYIVKLDDAGLIDTAYFPTTLDITGVSGDFTVGGNLIVSGATTTISSETLTVNDNVIVLNNNISSGTPTENGGIEVRRGGSTSASILWDETTDTWKVGLAGSEIAISTATDLSTHANDQTIHLTSSQNTWIDAITASATEVNYLMGVTSSIQTQLNNKQALDGDLTAIATIGTNGYLRRTATNTWSTQTAAQIKTEIMVPDVYTTTSGVTSVTLSQVENNWIVREDGTTETVQITTVGDVSGSSFGKGFVLHNGTDSHFYWLTGCSGTFLGAMSDAVMISTSGTIGDYVFNIDYGFYYVYNGSGWTQQGNPPYIGSYLGAVDSPTMNGLSASINDYCFNTDGSSYYSYDGSAWLYAGQTANTCGYTYFHTVNTNFDLSADSVASAVYTSLSATFTSLIISTNTVTYSTTIAGVTSDPSALTSGFSFTVLAQGSTSINHYIVINEASLGSLSSFVKLTDILYVENIGSSVQGYITNSTTGSGALVRAVDPTFTGTVTLPSTTSIGLVDSTEIGYLNGVTSSIQTQIGLKANSANPTFTGTVTLPSTTSIGSVSDIEIGYVNGVTSAIQTQIDGKAADGTNADITSITALGDGTTTNTAVGFAGAVNTGLYRSGTSLGLIAGGLGWCVTAVGNLQPLNNGVINISDGSVTNTGLASYSNAGTGLYFTSSGAVLNVAANGTQTAAFSASGVTLNGTLSLSGVDYALSRVGESATRLDLATSHTWDFKVSDASVLKLNSTGALVPAPSATSFTPDNSVMSLEVFRQKWAATREIAFLIESGAFQTNVSGTGATAQMLYGLGRVVAGTSASGTASLFKRTYSMFSTVGGPIEVINFSKQCWVTVYFSAGYNIQTNGGGNTTSLSTTAIARFSIGKNNAAGTLDRKGFGFEIYNPSGTNADLRAITYDTSLHNSANLQTIDFEAYSAAPGTKSILHSCTMYNDGAGNLYVYVDGVYKSVITTCPTGNSGNEHYIVFEVENGTDSYGSEAYIHEIRIAIAN